MDTTYSPDDCLSSTYPDWAHYSSSEETFDSDASPGFESDSTGDGQDEVPERICPGLLSLPAELRLLIYHWVYLMNPIAHKDLSPAYPTPVRCRYVLRRIDSNNNGNGDDSDSDNSNDISRNRSCNPQYISARSRLLSPDRPWASLPTSLLRTCRQIYHEARTIPFTSNEFVFQNWFSSGLYTAAALASAQRPWQRRAVRYARLEVRAEDLLESAALREWAKLCKDRGPEESAWAGGLRGLRLKIVDRAAGAPVEEAGVRDGRNEIEDAAAAAADDDDDGVADAVRCWVENAGLAELEKLDRLEVEFENQAWDGRKKVAWCEHLQRVLREMGSEAYVVCTERDES